MNIYKIAMNITTTDREEAEKEIFKMIAKDPEQIKSAIEIVANQLVDDAIQFKLIYDMFEEAKKDGK